MKKEITPDMYNYNKYPGPQFVAFEDVVKSDAHQFRLVRHTGAGVDAEAFTQRFSEILLKYDYIVGDWGNEQLRLRGFYKDDQHKGQLSKISRLDDYLKEYCNFGCDYFVLENPDPQDIVFEEEKQPSRRRRRSTNRKPADKRRDRRDRMPEEQVATVQPFKKKSRDRRPRKERERTHDGAGKQGHFTIRQKEQQ